MSNVMDKIAHETNGKSFKTFKYSFDSVGVPSFDYDDNQEIIWERIGETVTYRKTINLADKAKLMILHIEIKFFLSLLVKSALGAVSEKVKK
jgi:hypothetical protein